MRASMALALLFRVGEVQAAVRGPVASGGREKIREPWEDTP